MSFWDENMHQNCQLTAHYTHHQRSAALKVDWAKIGTSLGIKGQTAAGLQAFKKRNEDARRRVQVLSEQPQEIDFAHYRSILKNQTALNEIESYFKNFKPATYDVGRQIRAIEAFEAQAVKNAEQTKSKVDVELQDLQKTLTNIDAARSFEELTVVCVTTPPLLLGYKKLEERGRIELTLGLSYQDDVCAAVPEIEEKTTELVSKGRWSVPGYKVCEMRAGLMRIRTKPEADYFIGKIRRSNPRMSGGDSPGLRGGSIVYLYRFSSQPMGLAGFQ